MISSLLHLVGLRPRVYYTLINFKGGGKAPLSPPPLNTQERQSLGFGREPRIIFWEIWKFACCFAMRFVRGVRGHAPPRIFLKWYNFVRFGVYLTNFNFRGEGAKVPCPSQYANDTSMKYDFQSI